MTAHFRILEATLLSVALGASGLAQTEPPTLIRLVRSPSSLVTTGGLIQPYIDAKAPVTVLGLSSVSGAPETWLIEAHGSFASIEAVDRSVRPTASAPSPAADELLPPSTTLIAVYRPDWSYRPAEAMTALPKARYFNVTLYRTRPGSDGDFGEVVRLRRLRLDSINLDRPEMAYQVISGAPSGLYVFLAPLSSLKLMDNGMANTPAYAEAIREAGIQAGKKLIAEADASRENLLFRVEARASYAPEQ